MSATATVPTGTYILDPVHSTVGFKVRHNGVSTFHSQFDGLQAQLVDGVLSGTAEVGTIRATLPAFLEVLMSPEFFDTAKTPYVSFQSSSIRVADGGAAEVDGELTIRGVTRAIRATGTFATADGMHGPVAGFDLTTTVDRRQFGIQWQAPIPSGGEMLGWTVTIQAHLELARKDA